MNTYITAEALRECEEPALANLEVGIGTVAARGIPSNSFQRQEIKKRSCDTAKLL